MVPVLVALLVAPLPALAQDTGAQDTGAQNTAAENTGADNTAQEGTSEEGAVAAGEAALEERAVDEEITVTGTRVEGRSATDTPAPVDYIDEAALRSTGATETGKVLQLLAPSFNFSSTTISDGTDIIRPATLRALGPDQVLVLVNGKRRHQQSLLNVQQTVARGSAGYDINAIPLSAIDHIEVLRDGAAAQYGSDAIAGVINIILKDSVNRTDLVVDVGQHYAGDGEVTMAGVNTGFPVGEEGFVNLTVEYRDRGETNRAGPDSLRVSPPMVTQRIGDADSENISVWLNSAIPIGQGEFYVFGGYSNRQGDSSGFFRTSGDGRTVPQIYPDGFLPNILTEPTDSSLVLGFDGPLGDNWGYDAAINWGNSEFKFREENTLNVTYFFDPVDPDDPLGEVIGETPLAADTGTLTNEQLSATLDFTGTLDWNVGAGPLFMATGLEWRREGYKIEPGDEVSYEYGRRDDRTIPIFDQNGDIAQPGTQGFPGWSPREAVDDDRDSIAVYADFESQLSSKFLAGLALRFEDFSDFGNTINGKLSGRYDFNPRFSLRGTLSTGFRAPGVQQLFYSQRSTNLNAAGVLTDTLTARQGGPVTQAFGIDPLKEETSLNYSFGLVTQPSDRFRLTVDLYRIDIDDRIIFSSNIQPESGNCDDPADCPILEILDRLGVGQVLFFTNAIDTSTDGIDIVAVYDAPLGGNSLVTLEGAFHFNQTTVTAVRSSSDILPGPVLFDQAQETLIEEGQPGASHSLSGTYYRGPFSTNLRFNYFGAVSGEGFTPGFKQRWGGKILTDLSFTYSVTDDLSFTVGGLNIFDEFPDNWDPSNAFPFPQLGFIYGWETLPFGINGGYYFARFNYRFHHKRN